MYSILPSNKQSLFEKKREKLTNNLQIIYLMEESKSGMHGHGMPTAENAVEPHKPLQPNGNEMPTKGTTTTTIHESKHFPFVIIEHEVTNNETGESATSFHIGCQGQIVSQKIFDTFEKAEKYLNIRPWEIITNFVLVTFKNAFEYEKSQS